ncbi:MAG: Selenide, water dikinase [bacterium ADurb.Bin363]|nr:MAG: Selenide, water dikinase [bacterium ADurb.Bin363]
MPLIKHPDLLIGLENSDDAGVYRLTDDIALIQTVDFFTPIVDDPFIFGQIAVVNAMSDIYAMGGKPLTAMNIMAFPIKKLPGEILKQILLGGIEKIREAGALLIGGHSVEDSEIKYGLSVTGIIHPSKIISNGGAKPGDKLILTKPLGTGIISTAIKAGMASEKAIEEIITSMCKLNDKAGNIMQEVRANACTDITGFGLIGHLLEVLKASKVGAIIYPERVPVFSEAVTCAERGLVPTGSHLNRNYYSSRVKVDTPISPFKLDILYDAQTSGGLLISLPEERAKFFIEKFKEGKIIGEIIPQPEGRILLH